MDEIVQGSNPAVQKIAKMLADAFGKHGEKIREELIGQYRAGVDSFVERWKAMLEDTSVKGRIGYEYGERLGQPSIFSEWHRKLDLTTPAAAVHGYGTWEWAREWADHFVKTYRYADRDANEAYENARSGFIGKNVGKIQNVLGGRADLVGAAVEFRWSRGVFAGHLDVRLSDASFRAEVSLKYVVRHVPRTTPYFQYPLLFDQATVKEEFYRGPSEDELRMLLGATKSRAQEKREAEAAAGFCPMGGQSVPSELWAPVAGRMSPYVRCPSCGATVSASRGTFRKHQTPAAGKSAAAAKLETAGYCSMSGERVPQSIIEKMGPVEPYKDPKALCESCGQQVRLNAEKDWIPDPGGGYPTQMRVTYAKYYKHRLP